MGAVSGNRNRAADAGRGAGAADELGFRTRRRGIFTTDLDQDVLGWLGLNTATKHHPVAVEVNPVVGLRHQAVERLVAELRGERTPQLPSCEPSAPSS